MIKLTNTIIFMKFFQKLSLVTKKFWGVSDNRNIFVRNWFNFFVEPI